MKGNHTIMKGIVINKEQMNFILKKLDYSHFNIRTITGPTKQISPIKKNAFVESTRRYDKEKNTIHFNNKNNVYYYKKEFFKKYATKDKCIVMPFFEQISPSEYKYHGMYKFMNYDEDDDEINSRVELEHVHDLIF